MPENQLKWKAQPKQKEFLRLKVREALYGGAAGGGKSDALLAFACLYATKYAGSKILILRRTLAELQKEGSLIPRSLDLLSNTDWYYRDQKKKWFAPNGSVIEFGYCESESDVHQYQSAQYEVIIFDELTHFTEFQYTYLFSRCRSVKGYPACVRAATNPGNVGHAWVKKRFVSSAPHGTVQEIAIKNVVTNEMQSITRCFIPAKVWDNKILMDNDPNYILFLQSLPENERKALLDGDWDVFKGQYFYEWRYDRHVVEPFTIPSHWKRYVAMDWGMADPLACHWYAIDEDGRAWVYRELYTKGLIGSVAAEKINEMTPLDEKIESFVVSRDIFSKRGEAPESIGQTFVRKLERFSVVAVKLTGKKPRVSGWMKVREWLADAPDGLPWMMFFNTCIHMIRTLPEQIYDEKNVEDMAQLEDHCAEELRYFSVTHHRKPIVEDNKYKDLPMKDQDRLLRDDRERKAQKEENLDNFLTDVTL